MNDVAPMILALLAGGFLGGAFFWGLWWTVRRGVTARHPALLFLASMLLRVALTVWGFYLVAQGDLRRLVPCLLGFIAAPVLATRAQLPTLAPGGKA
jgi:F1F0 ATPase subunit 2